MIPHLRVPFEFGAVIEQDTQAEVVQCVFVIISYRRGDRIDEPTFGITDQAFSEGGIDLERLRAEVEEWEPRVRLLTDQQVEELVTTVRLNVERRD